jgi:hypothetical protein
MAKFAKNVVDEQYLEKEGYIFHPLSILIILLLTLIK